MVKEIYVAEIEPRYAETDMMGVVYHSNYLVWCEVARTGLYTHLGYDYTKSREEKVLWPVRRASLDYKRPSVYGKRVYVETRIKKFTGVRLIYHYTFSDQEGTTLATAMTEHGITDENLKVVNLYKYDEEMAKRLEEYKAICEKKEE